MSNWKSWVLTDVDNDKHVDSWLVSNADLGLRANTGWSIRKRTLRGGLRDGVEVVEVNNGDLSYSVVPTRGMGIWRGKFHDVELGWRSPARGPVHPAFVNHLDLGGIGWLAGFDEWIVRCGLSSNGAPGTDLLPDNQGNPQKMTLTLHGRIANIPAHYVEVRVDLDPPHEIEVIGHVDESMLFFPQLRLSTVIRTTPGSNRLTIADRVTNLRSQPAELELLYHCNFGRPLLGPNARLLAPMAMVAPRDASAQGEIDHVATYSGPTPGIVESAFWFELIADKAGKTLAVLQNDKADKACALRYSVGQLPCFTLWKNQAADSDGYVTGLEPGTNFPNLKTFEREQGRVVSIKPGGSYDAQVDVEVVDTADGVRRLTEEVAALQAQKSPTIHRAPHKKYSPV